MSFAQLRRILTTPLRVSVDSDPTVVAQVAAAAAARAHLNPEHFLDFCFTSASMEQLDAGSGGCVPCAKTSVRDRADRSGHTPSIRMSLRW
jgi:hypothetical protein